MDMATLRDGLAGYVYLLILLTFHEFAHAWTAWKCGDDTAKNLGRVSLNPVVHMDPVGTVLLPLLFIIIGSKAGVPLFFGWAKPVPVNIHNLRRGRIDDTFIAMAGPAMNLLLAAALMGLANAGMVTGYASVTSVAIQLAFISLVLCFFNLIPVPPLDGSHLVKNLVGMSYETYWKLSRFGFIAVLILINLPGVQNALTSVILSTEAGLGRLCGIDRDALIKFLAGI